jgi:hypothetical protein
VINNSLSLESKNKNKGPVEEESDEKRRASLKEKITNAILLVNEANAISEALNKNVVFELKLLSSFPRFNSDLQEDQLKRVLCIHH